MVFHFQVLCGDNAIIEVNLSVEFDIDDPILVSNSLNDITTPLKSLARSTLIASISRIDGMKIEQQIYILELSLKVDPFELCLFMLHRLRVSRMNSIDLCKNGESKLRK